MRNLPIGLLVFGVAVALGLSAPASAQQPRIGIEVYKDNPNQHIPTLELVNRWADMERPLSSMI